MQVIPAIDVLDGAVVRLRNGETTTGSPATATIRSPPPWSSAPPGRPWSTSSTWRGPSGVGHPPCGRPWAPPGSCSRPPAASAPPTPPGPCWKAGRSGSSSAPPPCGTRTRSPCSPRCSARSWWWPLDVRDGRAVGAGWEDDGRDLDTVLNEVVGAGVMRLMVTATAGDGMLSGPDLDLLERVIGQVEDPGDRLGRSRLPRRYRGRGPPGGRGGGHRAGALRAAIHPGRGHHRRRGVI